MRKINRILKKVSFANTHSGWAFFLQRSEKLWIWDQKWHIWLFQANVKIWIRKNNSHILNQHLKLDQNTKFNAKIILHFWLRTYYLEFVGRNFEKLLSYSKLPLTNFSKCKVSSKTRKTLKSALLRIFMLEFEKTIVKFEISTFE